MTDRALAVVSFEETSKVATAMYQSGFFADVKQASQAIVKILAGQELGFGPFASMTGVSIIQGKPSINANLLAAAIKRTPKYNYRVVELTETVCELEFLENGKPVGPSRFTWADAEKAGLTNKDNWRKYPRNMLFARALSNGQKWFCPDATNGTTVYTPDELGAVTDEDGNAITIVDVTPQPEPIPVTHDAPPPNGHKPPMTIEEAQNVTNSQGVRYGDLDNEKLSHMANSLAKIPIRTPEQETKLLAIQMIFEARKAEAAGLEEQP